MILQRVTSNEWKVTHRLLIIKLDSKHKIILTKNFLRKNEKNYIPDLELNKIRDNKYFGKP